MKVRCPTGLPLMVSSAAPTGLLPSTPTVIVFRHGLGRPADELDEVVDVDWL